MQKYPPVTIPFKAHPVVRGGHLQTILGYYLPAPMQVRATKRHRVAVSDGDHLIVCENPASTKAAAAKAIVLMHGLGGDAEASYMLRTAHLFQLRGWHVFRMNHRGCGEGRGLARNLYHSGRSEDIRAVLYKVAKLYPDMPMVAVGFSLSGNALLKLLGEQKESTPANLTGAIAVTPPVDLSACADALARPMNRIYNLRFILMLMQAIKQRQQDFPDFPEFDLRWSMSLRKFDDICTAPLSGFDSAEDYYQKCSAKQFLNGVSIPTFLLASDDDPFIPVSSFPGLPETPDLDVCITRSGGHMGYITNSKTPLGNHRWMDYTILKQAEHFLRTAGKITVKS